MKGLTGSIIIRLWPVFHPAWHPNATDQSRAGGRHAATRPTEPRSAMVSSLNPRGFYGQNSVFSSRNPFSRKARKRGKVRRLWGLRAPRGDALGDDLQTGRRRIRLTAALLPILDRYERYPINTREFHLRHPSPAGCPHVGDIDDMTWSRTRPGLPSAGSHTSVMLSISSLLNLSMTLPSLPALRPFEPGGQRRHRSFRVRRQILAPGFRVDRHQLERRVGAIKKINHPHTAALSAALSAPFYLGDAAPPRRCANAALTRARRLPSGRHGRFRRAGDGSRDRTCRSASRSASGRRSRHPRGCRAAL